MRRIWKSIGLGAGVALLVVSSSHPAGAQSSAFNVTGDVQLIRTGTTTGGKLQVPGDGLMGLRWLGNLGTGPLLADMHRFGAVDNRLYVTNHGVNNLTGVYLAVGATSWTSTSDERVKYEIEPVTGVLDKIRGIRVIEYNMANLGVEPSTGQVRVSYDRPLRIASGRPVKHEIGSVAQDWLAGFPQLVAEPKDEENGYYGLAYDRIAVIAIAAIQELEARVAQLERQLKAAQGVQLSPPPGE